MGFNENSWNSVETTWKTHGFFLMGFSWDISMRAYTFAALQDVSFSHDAWRHRQADNIMMSIADHTACSTID